MATECDPVFHKISRKAKTPAVLKIFPNEKFEVFILNKAQEQNISMGALAVEMGYKNHNIWTSIFAVDRRGVNKDRHGSISTISFIKLCKKLNLTASEALSIISENSKNSHDEYILDHLQ